MVRIDHHPNGPRLYVAGRRCHHGLAALLSLPFLWRHRTLRTWALIALAHDIADFPFRDCDNRH
jgi:hypothetical protein